MTEPLRFPVSDRDQPFDLVSLNDMTKETLDGDERRVVRQVALDLVMEHGSRIESFGDALDLIASAGPAGRRAMVDQARVEVGLPTIADEQFEVRQEVINRGLKPRWGLAQCAYPSCGRSPTTEGGALKPVDVRKWWCGEHAHLAEPGDFDPPPPRYVLNENFALVPVGEELERLQAEDRKRREEWERQEEAKRREGERLAKLRQDHEEETTISVAGVRVRLADGKFIPE